MIRTKQFRWPLPSRYVRYLGQRGDPMRLALPSVVLCLSLFACSPPEDPSPGDDLGSPMAADMSTAATPDAAMSNCNPATCAGCCMGDLCQMGITSAACGKGAGTCAVCSGIDVCLPDQTCGLSQDKAWKITLEGISVDATTPAGLAWDFPNGAPDPYLTVNGLMFSAVNADTYFPVFPSITETTQRLLQGSISLAVYDDDIAADDVIAPSRALKVTEAELRKGTVEWMGWGAIRSVRFKFEPK